MGVWKGWERRKRRSFGELDEGDAHVAELGEDGVVDFGEDGGEDTGGLDGFVEDELGGEGEGETDGLGHGGLSLRIPEGDEGGAQGLSALISPFHLEGVLEEDHVPLVFLVGQRLLQQSTQRVYRRPLRLELLCLVKQSQPSPVIVIIIVIITIATIIIVISC